MAIRKSSCIECGSEVVSGARGKIPDRCPECQYVRNLAASKAWKYRNPEHIRDYSRRHYLENIDRYREWAADGRRNRDPEVVSAYRRGIYLERQQATIAESMRDYRKRNPGKHAEIENRRRARRMRQFIAPVDPLEIRQRDLGRCGICGEFVSVEEQSIDHIVPLARGGTHEPSNVQLAHRRCNSSKGARLLS